MTAVEPGLGSPRHHEQTPRRRLLALLSLQVVALCIHPVLSVWQANVEHGVDVRNMLVLGGATASVALALVAMLSRGFRRRPLMWFGEISLVVIVFFSWDPLHPQPRFQDNPLNLDPADLLPAVVMILAVALARRYGETVVFRRIVAGYTAGVTVAVVVALTAAVGALDPSELVEEQPVAAAPGRATPDVWFILLDGYGSSDVLRDLYGFDNTSFAADLRRNGFAVPSRATTNYSMTYVSMPSMLGMQFPLGGGHVMGPEERIALYRSIGGDNPVARSLRSMGYEYVHVESGWGGSRCGPVVDRCIRAPFLNEATWRLIARTPAGAVLSSRIGHPFSVDSVDRLDRLDGLAAERPGRRPRFVFAHILIPHAPLFVDAACEVDVRPRLNELNIGNPFFLEQLDIRRAAYVDQVRCVNTRMSELVRAIPRDAMMIITGDHGPDSLGQQFTDLAGWSREALRERMSIFSAIRVDEHCPAVPDDLAAVNSFRIVMTCLTGRTLPMVEPRHFLVPLESGAGERTLEVDLDAVAAGPPS